MSSKINTNGIDANYPVPGKNNSSQGFRDNFGQVKNNLNIAATEITDLQAKVLLKAGLDGTVLNNDMANAQISNCSTRGFRSTTFNLGSSLSGTVLVNVNGADVQEGIIAGNTVLQFGGWSPTGTESNVVLKLSLSPNIAPPTISLPNQCVSSNNNFGVTVLENYQDAAGTATLTFPANVEILEYKFSSMDCGNTITVTPINRPQQSTQVITRPVPPTGVPGDVAGKVAVDANYIYVCTGNFDSTIVEKEFTATSSIDNSITLSNTTGVVVDSPIIFTVDSFGGVEKNKVYYVKSIIDGFSITISDSRTAGTAGPEFAVTTATGNGIATCYTSGTDIWKRVTLGTW